MFFIYIGITEGIYQTIILLPQKLTFILWCESQTNLLEILKYTLLLLLLTDHHTVEYITKIYFLYLSEILIPLIDISPFLHISFPPYFSCCYCLRTTFLTLKREEILSITTLTKWDNTVVTELN